MKKFELYIITVNDAFETPEEEVSRVLNEVSKKILKGEISGLIKDFNGNTVGNYISRA